MTTDTGHTEKFGSITALQTCMATNLNIVEKHFQNIRAQAPVPALRLFFQDTLQRFGEKILHRQRSGSVRNCHGDLHLGNIVLLNDKPYLFDCIEFSDELRIIDVISDVAFLIMDCDAKKHPDLGFRFLSRYLELTSDYSALSLLPLYLSYRACVRGKVACLLADDQGISSQTRVIKKREAATYLSLAHKYTKPYSASLYVIGGFSGSGKSHLSLQALSHIRAIIIRSDATRKRLAILHPGEYLYGKSMDARCYKAMYKAAETSLLAGFTVILDATFLRQSERDEARTIAKKTKLPIYIYWLEIDTERLRKRIRQRMQTGTDISDADLEVLEAQLASCRRPQEKDIRFLTDSNIWPEAE